MKTKLGVPVPFLGMAVFFIALVGGWVPTVLLTGYILLFETDNWLKASAAKAIVIVVFFALLNVFIGFIPNIITLIDNVAVLFNQRVTVEILTEIVALINTILGITQRVILIVLGILALRKKTIAIKAIDRIFDNTQAEDRHTEGN